MEAQNVKNADKSRNVDAGMASGSYRLPRKDGENEALVVGLRKKERSCSVNRRGKVLVMDDEDVIRTILSVMLLAFGYESHLTADGEEAIQSYTDALDAGEPFDAVIMDLNVPKGLGGVETMRRLREIDPGVRAIVCSGFNNNPAMEKYREHGFLAVLHKPYSISELRNVLNEVVRGAGSGRDNEMGIADDKENKIENLAL